MEPQPLESGKHYTTVNKIVQELRVNAEELAASFPESTRFDTPPQSLVSNSSQENLFANPNSETAFFPIDNTPTLEPITDSITGNEIREKDEQRIIENMQGLANMKLRAEVPYFKQQELEETIEELTSALHQKDEHLKQMGTSFRNHQRTFANRVKDYEQRLVILENKNRQKATILKVLSPILFFLCVLPFLIKPAPMTLQQKDQIVANDYKHIKYVEPKKPETYYIVQPKDTLSSISKKVYGDSKFVYTIQKTNNLKDNRIKPGTKLIIAEIDEE